MQKKLLHLWCSHSIKILFTSSTDLVVCSLTKLSKLASYIYSLAEEDTINSTSKKYVFLKFWCTLSLLLIGPFYLYLQT